MEDIGTTNQILFIALIHKKCIEVDKKNTRNLMDKKHHIEIINATKEGWAVGLGAGRTK